MMFCHVCLEDRYGDELNVDYCNKFVQLYLDFTDNLTQVF